MAGVAIVGASDRGIPWTEWVIRSLEQYGYADPIRLVNPNRDTLLGRRCFPSLADLPEAPELGIVVVGAERALPALEQLLDGGTRRVVIVSNGFGELRTPEGLERERRLRELTADRDAIVVGPNCVGFASFHENLCAISQPVPAGIVPGPVSIISQSGGLTGAAIGAVSAEGIGVDQCYSIGNGSAFGLSQAIRYLAARETTKVICCVAEALGSRAELEAAAEAADAHGVLLVFLVLGKSSAGRRVAESHTGAVVGEERTLASLLRDLGVVLADTPEQLGRIARLHLELGPATRPRRGFIATVSGGGAGLTADMASRHDVRLAQLSDASVETLRAALPDGAYVGNPLDVQTGDGTLVYSTLAGDPDVDYLVEPWVLPWPDESDRFPWQRAALERITGIGRDHGIPVVVSSLFHQEPSDWARELGRREGVSVTPDLDLTLAALGKLYPASAAPAAPEPPATHHGSSSIEGEAPARLRLAALGLPVVEGREAANADEVVAAARELRTPLALKVSLADVGHKERIGGVRLGLSSAAELREACAAIVEGALAAGAAASADDVRFLVTEMRFGPEILVGALRDAVAGPTLTVAVGGWAAEAGAVFGTVVLPKSAGELDELAARWRLPHLLGTRRTDALVGLLARLGDEFATGELAGFQAVELNPVILDGEGAVIVDALIVRG